MRKTMARKKKKTPKSRKNRVGYHIGIKWDAIQLDTEVPYFGTADGAKANVWRANQKYKPKRFISYQSVVEGNRKRSYILRVA